MNELDVLNWLYALTYGDVLPGEYRPGTNPLDVMGGAR